MAAVPAQIPDEFGPGPIEGLVLRFLKDHRLCAVWEGKVKLNRPPAEYSFLILHYVDFFFLSFHFQNSKFVNGITSFECIVMPIS